MKACQGVPQRPRQLIVEGRGYGAGGEAEGAEAGAGEKGGGWDQLKVSGIGDEGVQRGA